MRNLKRALSLALASVMLLGMMVVGTSASFKDVDENDNVEAIAVAEMLGLMVGNEGNFMPDKTVTREEMAGILAKLLLLDVDHFNGVSNFTDVDPGQWYAPAIAACAADGFFAGIGGGKFGLGTEMTVNQVGLLLCKVLGYFQTSGDYGENPDLAATLQASKAGLFAGLSGVSKDAKITRNQMVQMCLNALKAPKVEMVGNGGVTIEGNGFTITTGAATYEEITSSDTDVSEAISDKADGGDAFVELGEDIYNGDLELKPNGGKADDFGRPGKIWTYKGAKVNVASPEKPVLTYENKEVSGKDIWTDLGKPDSAEIADTTAYFVDGNGTTSAPGLDKDSGDDKVGGKGAIVEVYEAETDGQYIMIVINSYLLKATADYDEDDKSVAVELVSADDADTNLASVGEIKSEDFAVAETCKKNDYLLVTIAAGEIKTAAKAETVTASVTGYTKGKSVTAGGTKYEYSSTVGTPYSAGSENYTMKEDYVLVLDSFGNLLYAEGVTEAEQYVAVVQVASNSVLDKNATYIADVIFPDGTRSTVDINKINDSTGTEAGAYEDVKGWCTYTVKDGKYTLKQVADAGSKNGKPTDEEEIIKPDTTTIKANKTGSKTSVGTKSTVFVVLKGKDVKVYTGIQNVPTIKAGADTCTTEVYLVEKNDFATYVFVDLGNGTIEGASTEDSDVIYIYDYDTTENNVTEDGDEYVTYKAIVNGKATTVDATTGWSIAGDGLLKNVTRDEDGWIDGGTLVSDTGNTDYNKDTLQASKAVKYSGGILTVEDGKEYKLADDCVVMTVKGDTVKTVSAEKLAKDLDGATTANQVIWTALDDGYVTYMIVDLDTSV